ncbi:MAG: hypothetical protein V3S69_06845 [Dehalococcoidales bacterium]
MSNPDQAAVELETVSLEHALVMGEAWQRLQRNGDFKRIIMNGFLKEKVLASVSLLAVPQIKDKGRRPDVMEDLIAASNLQYFFQIIEHEYEGAKNPILSDEEEAELAAEEAAKEAANGVA